MYQKGRSGLEAAKRMLGEHTPESDLERFRKIKKRYVEECISDAELCPGFLETRDYLVEKGKLVWICTSAPIELIEPVMEAHPELNKAFPKLDISFKGNVAYKGIVNKGMYTNSKPSGEPLLVTLEKMGLEEKRIISPQNAIYIGDAFPDYQSAVDAKMGFVYYCPENSTFDKEIPRDVPCIRHHEELKELIRM